jgi:protein-L-isoaspartate(D-aspartate) O-methyltransferase
LKSGESRVESQNGPAGSRPSTLDSGLSQPAGWHYQRQLTLENDPATAPSGRQFVTFKNEEPGLAAHALQGFAIDGRKVAKLKLDYSVRGRNIRPGSKPTEWPMIVFTFYDDRRAVVDEARVGPFDGTFDWRTQSDTVSVPLKARECVFRIGLLGAVGEISLDNLRITAIP